MKKFILYIGTLIFFLSSSYALNAQDLAEFEALFLKTEAFYNNASEYAVDITYQFSEDVDGVEAVETMEGAIQKKGNNYYSKTGPTEYFYIGNTFLKINHDERAVQYAKVENPKMTTPIEVKGLLPYFECAQVVKTKSSYLCELDFVQHASLPYKKMVLELDATTFEIKKQVLYFLPGKEFPGQASMLERTKAGKLTISLSPRSKKEIDNSLFKKSNYIVDRNGISLSKNLSNYTLYNSTL